ncbi:MAG: cytochrome c3 family protein [Proteobacteria bacterium]|nr:cytochrome c3 family protein [Pseudomonadota bacterium]
MKRSLFMTLMVAALALALALPLYAAAPKAPADGLAMKAPAGAKQPVVKFNHGTHKSAKCADCHHKKAGANEFAKCDSKGCHADYAAKTGKDSYYAAFHGANAKSCLGCHKAVKDKSPTAPTACPKCHVKG